MKSLRYPTLSELEDLGGSGRPKRRVSDEVPLSSLGRVDTLRRFGVAEAEVLALWRRRATPAPRGEAAAAAEAEEGDVEAFSEGDNSGGYEV